MKVQNKRVSDLDKKQAAAIGALIAATWPHKGRTPAMVARSVLHWHRDPHKGARSRGRQSAMSHMVWEGDVLVAHALSFAREVRTARGPLTILALASVCVREENRGEGLGALVARLALRRVDDRTFPVAVYQTRVPGFYKNLGAKAVKNRFVNSLGDDPQANAFWDPHMMIYPKTFDWPRGRVDMLGPGY